MFRRKLTYGDAFLIIVNLVPLFGVWFEGWEPRQMFLIYCLETVIIGGYNIIKMFIVTLYKKKDVWEGAGGSKRMVSGLFFILFFIVHYGFFVFIQTAIFTGVSGLGEVSFGPLNFLSRIFSLATPDTRLVLYSFILIYGLRMVTDFIVSGRYRHTSLGLLMFQPYLRIFVQQFVVILGSMFLSFGGGKIFMLIFVSIKLYFEVFINFDKYLDTAEKMQKLKEIADKKEVLIRH